MKRYKEAFSSKKLNNIVPKIFSVLEKRINQSIFVSSEPMDFTNAYGAWSGAFGIIGDGNKAIRLNWFIGKTSSSINSVDIWDNVGDTPDVHIDTEGLNIVQIIDTIESYLSGDSDLMFERRGRKSASNDILLSWIEDERIPEDYIAENKTTFLWDEFNRWQYRQNQYEPISSSTFRKFLQQYMMDNKIEKRKGKVSKGSQEKSVVSKKSKSEFQAMMELPIEEKYRQIKSFINMIMSRVSNGMIVSGRTATGKTENTKAQLDELNADYTMITGAIKSAKELYRYLYWHRNDAIVVFDDCDSAIKDKNSANILKGALETNLGKGNKVSFLDKDFIDPKQIATMTKRQKEKVIPNTFEFDAGIIFITNVPITKINSAILSRTLNVDLNLTNEEVLEVMERDMENFPPPDVKKEFKLKAFNLLTKYKKDIKDLNFRDYIKTIIMAATKHSLWEKWALAQILATR